MTSTLAPLDWRSLGRPHDRCTTDMIRAVDVRSSDWTIYPEQKRGDRRLVQINYTAPIPEGETKKEWLVKVLDRNLEFDDPADHRLWQTVSNREVGRAVTQDFAKQLVERLRGHPGDQDARAILTDGGFRLYDEVYAERWPDIRIQNEHPNWYSLNVGKGGLMVTLKVEPEIGIDCTYSPNRSRFSHSLLILTGDQFNHDDTHLIPVVWPDGCDPMKVGARFIVDVLAPWVRDNRMDLL